MSRHKLVKNLDLEDELDDYDGGEDYEDDGGAEELSEEDKENMAVGTIAVRAELPAGAAITEKQIHDALWHYYYDIEKTVAYLLNTYVSVKPKTKKEGKQEVKKKATETYACTNPFSSADFFKDSPWLNIPSERQTIFIAPLYPRGGLLGGSSDGASKMSKLQQLAAARKKKAQEQKAGDLSGVAKPMANLTLGGKEVGRLAEEPTSRQRSFLMRKRKDSNPHEKAPKAPPIEKPIEEDFESMNIEPLDQAEPSAFANTMFSKISPAPATVSLFSLPYAAKVISTVTNPFTGPSPDDVVIAAQSKASGKGGKGPPKTSGEKKADQIANGIEALKVVDTPRATSKNLDVLMEYEKLEKKKEANFVVIGHVDAGKSTLMGRLLLDTGVIDQRTIDKHRKDAEAIGKASFALAWVMDQGTEERTRGVTIDIAMNKFCTAETNFTILDAPGHRDFIPNMIAGASQADFAVLVIDASTGSFESGLRGQTKEHALLVRSMGVQRIIIAINKLDTVSWSQDRFLEISNQISAFLTTAGFLAKNISFIPCSGLHGDNIMHPPSSVPELTSWYHGPTLLQALEISEPIKHALNSPLRLTISDLFRGGVQNPLSISGRIEAGSLQTGDALLAQPANQKCFIKSLVIGADNEPSDWAVAGQNVTLHLSNIDPIYLKIGDVLCSPKDPIQNISEFTAKVLAFEFLVPGAVDVHRGRLHTPGRVREIVGLLDKNTGLLGAGKKKVKIVKPGQVARVVVELDVAVPLEAPSKIVLRSGGATVAAGLLE